MAMMHARICGACERECPSWADRCPACGSQEIGYRLTIVSPSTPVAAISDARQARTKPRRRITGGHEPPRTPARSTA